jgi:hypothetical protein
MVMMLMMSVPLAPQLVRRGHCLDDLLRDRQLGHNRYVLFDTLRNFFFVLMVVRVIWPCFPPI